MITEVAEQASEGPFAHFRMNEDERYERVTTQDNLVAASNPAKGGSDGLMERTFGHG